MSFAPKISKIVRPLSSLASFKIRLRSTSTSSGPNRASNASTCTFTLKLLSRNCFILPIVVLSLAFRPLHSSSYLPWALTREVYEFCKGVGGVIPLLESGCAFSGESSYLISSFKRQGSTATLPSRLLRNYSCKFQLLFCHLSHLRTVAALPGWKSIKTLKCCNSEQRCT